jgi:hypothetical protein
MHPLLKKLQKQASHKEEVETAIKLIDSGVLGDDHGNIKESSEDFIPILSESPIHFFDAIRKKVQSGDYNKNVALTCIDLQTYVVKLQSFTDLSVNKIAIADAKTTFLALKAIQKSIPVSVRNRFIKDFNEEHKTRILNDLEGFEKKLINYYDEIGIDLHNDR